MSTPFQRKRRDWRPLPAPHMRVRVLVEADESTVYLDARGTPDDLVAAGLALPEWVAARPKGKRIPELPDGSQYHWYVRSPKQAVWHLWRRTGSLEVARRWPGVPADIDFAAPEAKPAESAKRPQNSCTAAEWKAYMLGRLQISSIIAVAETDQARQGKPYAFASHDGRFEVATADVADLLALEAKFHREFTDRFTAARIIDRNRHGMRLVVDNTRPEAP